MFGEMKKNEIDSKVQRALDSIQIELLTAFPFYGRISTWLKWVLLPRENAFNMPYAATDGKSILWNHGWIEDELGKFSFKEVKSRLLFVAIHEIHHVIKKHPIRMGERSPSRWNRATDYSINWELKQACSMNNAIRYPEDLGILYDTNLGPLLEEAIYNKLDDPDGDQGNSLSIGGVLPFKEVAGSAGRAKYESDLDIQIEAAAQSQRNSGKDMGYLPGSIRDLIDSNKKPQVNWRSQLRRFISPHFPTDISWSTPNRRLLSRGMYFPGVIKDGVGKIGVGIDTSGSVTPEELSVFVSEMKSILSDCKPEKLEIMWFHSHVWRHDSFSDQNDFVIPEDIESGGTVFTEVFDKIDGEGIDLKALVMLTDGYSNYPEKPKYPVIWCCTTDYDIPFGDVCRIKV